jgi:glycosyltransferase involved in cell wall biosynthesis
MNIGINGYEAVVPRFGFNHNTGLPNRVGSSEFCYQVLLNLYRFDKKNKYTIFLPTKPSSDLPKESESWRYEVFPAKRLWTLLALGKKISGKKKELDVFFSPTHYIPIGSSVPSVISILDVSYLHFPHLFGVKDLYQLKIWGKYSIKKASKITTISKSSKNDIIKAYGINESKIAVVYPGVKQILNMKLMDKKELARKFNIEGDYILFVGTLQPRKNVARLIEAFSKLKNNLTLVIIGKKGWQYEDILSAPSQFGVSDKVKFLENVSDEELPSFYKNAECFVLPSLYEGFGLPIVEAMQYGCPVVTSNISSLPEAGGDAALYVDPKDVGDIARKITQVLEDKELREEMIKKGYNQIKKFSWEKSARQTLNVLEELANEKNS